MATSSRTPCAWSRKSGTSKPAHPALARVNRASVNKAVLLVPHHPSFFKASRSRLRRFFCVHQRVVHHSPYQEHHLAVYSFVWSDFPDGFHPSFQALRLSASIEIVLIVMEHVKALVYMGKEKRHSAGFFVSVTPDSVEVASSHISAGLLTA